MPSGLYLAMTAAEFQEESEIFHPIAYMACHFSPYGRGLSNIPLALPAGSLLMLNDRTPPMGHDPRQVAQELTQAAEALACSRILLDFQRPDLPEIRHITEAIVRDSNVPVGVSWLYAEGFDCPVLLPPVQPEELPDAWVDRELWLEIVPQATTITVTESGAIFLPRPAPEEALPLFDEALCCHYRLELFDDRAVFTLYRSLADYEALAHQQKITTLIGLYQQWWGDYGSGGLRPP